MVFPQPIGSHRSISVTAMTIVTQIVTQIGNLIGSISRSIDGAKCDLL